MKTNMCIALLLMVLLLLGQESCTSIAYIPLTKRIETPEVKSIRDTLYLLANIPDIFLLHYPTSQDLLRDSLGNVKSLGTGVYSEVDTKLTEKYNAFVPELLQNRVSTKLKCKNLELKEFQRDSIKVRVKRMVRTFYTSNEREFCINLSDLELKRSGYALVFYTESENKDYEFWQSLAGSRRQQTMGVAFFHACVINLVSGKVVYYKYHFEPGMYYYLHYSMSGFYETMKVVVGRLVDPLIKEL